LELSLLPWLTDVNTRRAVSGNPHISDCARHFGEMLYDQALPAMTHTAAHSGKPVHSQHLLSHQRECPAEGVRVRLTVLGAAC
jgi:hypothetical protein